MKNADISGPIEDDATIAKIVNAAESINGEMFELLAIGDDVRELSSNTVFESLEILTEGILASGESGFEASATVYITLNYGGSRDPVSIPDSYPAVVRGTIGPENVEIVAIEVDTGSFYQ